MVKDVVTQYESLSQRAVELAVNPNRQELDQVVLDLKDTILQHNLACLAAPQIGYNRRVFCLNFSGDIRAFINPMIVKVEGLRLSRERCESLEGEYIIPRHQEVIMTFQTPVGKMETNKFTDEAAALVEQCQDLLDGVLLCDYGLKIDEAFDQASEEEREEVLTAYLQALENTLTNLNHEIEQDETLRKTRDAIDFMESVAKGETHLEEKPVKLNRATRRLIDKWTKKKRKIH